MLTKEHLYATAVKYQSKSCYVQNVRNWATLNFIKFFGKKVCRFWPLKIYMPKICTKGANYIENKTYFFKTKIVKKVTCLSARVVTLSLFFFLFWKANTKFVIFYFFSLLFLNVK